MHNSGNGCTYSSHQSKRGIVLFHEASHWPLFAERKQFLCSKAYKLQIYFPPLQQHSNWSKKYNSSNEPYSEGSPPFTLLESEIKINEFSGYTWGLQSYLMPRSATAWLASCQEWKSRLRHREVEDFHLSQKFISLLTSGHITTVKHQTFALPTSYLELLNQLPAFDTLLANSAQEELQAHDPFNLRVRRPGFTQVRGETQHRQINPAMTMLRWHSYHRKQ